jgi:hypothetical protein
MTWPAELYSPAELHAMSGYVQPAAQRRWLEMHGIPYVPRRDGVPLVRRDDVRPATSASAINLGALDARRKTAKAA